MERKRPVAEERETAWQVEIVSAARNSHSGSAAPAGASLMRTVVSIAIVSGVIGLLALMLAFAATIALIAVPVAVGAGLVAWLGTKWRAARGR